MTQPPSRSAVSLGWAILAINGLIVASSVLLLRNHVADQVVALLAYLIGMRHALDADHIAAIDNVNRRLVDDGKPSRTVGLYFSLGHCTLVILVACAVAFTGSRYVVLTDRWRDTEALFGTLISTAFLFAMAWANWPTLLQMRRRVRSYRSVGKDLGGVSRSPRGLIARWVSGPLSHVNTSPHMYPIGFLFALGFDSASEVTLLGLSAHEIGGSLGSMWPLILFAVVFAAGMTLVDTLQGMFMMKTYLRCISDRRHQAHYDLFITALTVVVAVFIGGMQLLNLVGAYIAPNAEWVGKVARLNEAGHVLGAAAVVLFGAVWAISYITWGLPAGERARN